MTLEDRLEKFATKSRMQGKGALSVALVVTRHAKSSGLPLNADGLLTKAGGQVLGLGKGAVQSILGEHGISRVLAEEGGRTSRGSVGNMRKYVAFLNDLASQGDVPLDEIEKWWVDRVRDFFAKSPFILHLDESRSRRAVIRDLLEQCKARQSESNGATIVGTMLQHLVGAKLNLLLDKHPEHHGANTADDVSGRDGDFLIDDVVIHVSTSPSESLLRKCKRNLENEKRPVIITIDRGVQMAEGLAENLGIADRLDVFEAEQFLAGNLYEIGKFVHSGRRETAERLMREYNDIIEHCETDPGLRIEVR